MKKLGRGAITTGSGTLIYTVPTGQKVEVLDINITNTTASPITLGLYLVPTGTSAATSNALFYGAPIPGNTTVQWTGVELLNAGDFIQGIGSAAGLTLNISGNEYRANA